MESYRRRHSICRTSVVPRASGRARLPTGSISKDRRSTAGGFQSSGHRQDETRCLISVRPIDIRETISTIIVGPRWTDADAALLPGDGGSLSTGVQNQWFCDEDEYVADWDGGSSGMVVGIVETVGSRSAENTWIGRDVGASAGVSCLGRLLTNTTAATSDAATTTAKLPRMIPPHSKPPTRKRCLQSRQR